MQRNYTIPDAPPDRAKSGRRHHHHRRWRRDSDGGRFYFLRDARIAKPARSLRFAGKKVGDGDDDGRVCEESESGLLSPGNDVIGVVSHCCVGERNTATMLRGHAHHHRTGLSAGDVSEIISILNVCVLNGLFHLHFVVYNYAELIDAKCILNLIVKLSSLWKCLICEPVISRIMKLFERENVNNDQKKNDKYRSSVKILIFIADACIIYLCHLR